MARKVTATVEVCEGCPLFKKNDLMTLDLPEIVDDESSSMCAIAVADLLSSMVRLAAGGAPPGDLLACRGCRAGRARAHFRLAVLEEIDASLISSLRPTLERLPLFSGLPSRQLEKIIPMVSELELPDGYVLIEHGAPGQALFIIASGTVDIIKPDEEGNETYIASLGEGECIGEMSLLTGDPCSASIRAQGPVDVLCITKADFGHLLRRTPSLNAYFSRLLALRLKQTSNQLLDKLDSDISGDLSMLTMPEIIQAVSATTRTGSLGVYSEHEIEIVFRSGQIIRIESSGGYEEPKEAFYDALGWSHGKFKFTTDIPDDIEPNISMGTMGLLLEGMRRLDEV